MYGPVGRPWPQKTNFQLVTAAPSCCRYLWSSTPVAWTVGQLRRFFSEEPFFECIEKLKMMVFLGSQVIQLSFCLIKHGGHQAYFLANLHFWG